MPRQRKLRLEDPLRCKLVIVGCGGVGKTSLLCTYARGEFPEPYVAASFDGYVADVELPLESIPGLNLEVWERKPGWLRRVKELLSSTFKRSSRQSTASSVSTAAVASSTLCSELPAIQSLNEEVIGLNVLNVEMALWDTAGSDDYDRLRPLSYLDAHVFLVCFSVGERGILGYVEDKWADEVRHFCGTDVPIILVACKSDLRGHPGRRGGESVVSTSEGEAAAQRINALHYFEVSAKRDGVEGIGEVFVSAAKEAVRYRLKVISEDRRGRREGLKKIFGTRMS